MMDWIEEYWVPSAIGLCVTILLVLAVVITVQEQDKFNKHCEEMGGKAHDTHSTSYGYHQNPDGTSSYGQYQTTNRICVGPNGVMDQM